MCVRTCVRVCGVCGQLSNLHNTHAWLMPISAIHWFLFPIFLSGKEFSGHSAMSWISC